MLAAYPFALLDHESPLVSADRSNPWFGEGAVDLHRMHDHASLRATDTVASRCEERLAIAIPKA
jgi:hypothetical protein